jgi:thiamine-monophosphate kinase
MAKGELAFVDWLTEVCRVDPARVPIGVGDDMAAIRLDGSLVTITADMLLDGVHFDTTQHKLEQIGRKAIGCSLSDCAAMACRPRGAVVSLALPNAWTMDQAKRLAEGMIAMADEYACPFVGGDTTSWDHPLAMDVAMLAEPMSPHGPVTRDGAKPGDVLIVTGQLGGSLLGKHLAFTPRLADAEHLVTEYAPFLHAMIDITDGLAIDAYRLCRASGCSALLEEPHIELVAGDRAHDAAKRDGRSPLDHALYDGEDFELLVALHPDALTRLGRAPRVPMLVGRLNATPEGAEPDIALKRNNTDIVPLEPRGYEHFR